MDRHHDTILGLLEQAKALANERDTIGGITDLIADIRWLAEQEREEQRRQILADAARKFLCASNDPSGRMAGWIDDRMEALG